MEWYTFILAILPIITGFGGLWYGNRLNTKSQIKHSILQSRIDEKKKWMSDLRLDMAEYIAILGENMFLIAIVNRQLNSPNPTEEEMKIKATEFYKNYTKLLSSRLKVDCLLDDNIKNQSELKTLIYKTMDLTRSSKEDGTKIEDKFTQLGSFIREINTLTTQLIKEESEKLKQIEKEIN